MGRLILFFILIYGWQTALTQSRDPLVSVNLQQAPFAELIKTIEQQTNYRFYYRSQWVDTIRVTISAQNESLQSVLNKVLGNSKVHFFILDKRVILTNNIFIVNAVDSVLRSQVSNENARYNYSFRREEYNFPPEPNALPIVEIGTRQKTLKGTQFSIRGIVKDKKTGEPLTGATLFVEGLKKGTSTNADGSYSLSLNQGAHMLLVRYTGMKTRRQRVIVHGEGHLDFLLEEDLVSLKAVTIESDHDANVNQVQMGVSTVELKRMKNVPKVLGENDVLKVALTLPGIKTIGEGAAGINVRGGNADQNLMLINEATIYNPTHFLGFFSVFNADAIQSFEIYKSAIPAQYGGRLSSIFDMQMKEGNLKKFSGEGGVGPITSHLTLEVPIIKNKLSILAGGRTTYSDWVLHQIPKSEIKNSSASFYDFFARITHIFDTKNTLSLSGYYSKDRFRLSTDSLFSYHNALGSLQWRHTFTERASSIVSITHSDYQYQIDYQAKPISAFDMGFHIGESQFKWEMSNSRQRHKIDYGLQAKLYSVSPGTLEKSSAESTLKPLAVQKQQGLETAVYLADNFDINQNLSVYAGIRFSSFAALGPATRFQYLNDLPKTDATVSGSVSYNTGALIKMYAGPEYRFSMRYKLTEESSLKASYNRTRQYIHMLSNTVSVSPTNTWTLSNNDIKPQIADQVSAGFYRDLNHKMFQLSAEVYYKWIDNIIDYKTGSRVLLNEHIERDVLQGQGKAYGLEILLRKRTGKLSGWVGYTYSRTFIKMNSPFFEDRINEGQYYPANYDKPHDVSIISNYKITQRYSFSFNFVYSTGRPITYPVGMYQFGSGYRISYSDRNQFRIPDYFRCDIGFNVEGNHKIKKLAHSFWSFSIYNLLGRKNPYSVYFVASDAQIRAYKLSIFGAPIPTITYNFRF